MLAVTDRSTTASTAVAFLPYRLSQLCERPVVAWWAARDVISGRPHGVAAAAKE